MSLPDDRRPADDAHEFRDAASTTPIDRARLAAHLAGVGLPLDAATPIRQFASGFANINYLLRAGGRPLVLRRPPSGELPPGAHDMAREHRILSRLWKALPLAPESVHLCEDRAVIGVPFQLIEYRPGVVLKGSDTAPFAGRPEVAARVGAMLVETLGAVHAVEPAAVGLETLGKPAGFVARQIEGWIGRARRIGEQQPTVNALADEIGRWLAAARLGERPATLLHSDFKLDNLILDPATLAPRAIVDWDMGTRGDPLFDLATMTSYWTEPGDPACMHRMEQMPTAMAGFPTRAEVVAAYGRATGRDVSDWPAMRVLAQFKLAVVFLQLEALNRRGENRNPRFAHLDGLGEELLLFTRDVATGRAR
jgi:aminoglycoside phosphotransferase (APT) family kinase protein